MLNFFEANSEGFKPFEGGLALSEELGIIVVSAGQNGSKVLLSPF